MKKKRPYTRLHPKHIVFHSRKPRVYFSDTKFRLLTKYFYFFTYPAELEHWTHSVELVVVGEHICEQDPK